MPQITYGHGGGAWESEPPPILFPLIKDYTGDDQYRYVMERLAEMAGYTRDDTTGALVRNKPNTLYLTDIFRGPSHVRDTVGLSLHGRVLDPMTRVHRSTEDQDIELMQAVRSSTAKIRCIQGRAESVKFKRGVVNDPRGRVLGSQYKQGISMDGATYATKVPRRVDQWVDYQSREADLPLLDAWICLGSSGAYCRAADSVRLQDRLWLFEEIRPETAKVEKKLRA